MFVLAPGGAATEHLVDARFLRRMKPTAVLVNASRGTLVDSDALATALRECWIWGAGLDVVTGEPNINADHPLVKEARCVSFISSVRMSILIWSSRCVVLPHIGSATIETRIDMATLAVNNALAVISGEAMPASLEF